MFIIYAVCAVIGVLAYYLTERSRTKAQHHAIIEREGCKPLRCLPNKWFPPFGLDKLRNVIHAEATKTYPLLMLEDHEKFGDTYAQWGGSMYTVITRDTTNIRALLSVQFKSFEVGSGRHGCVKPLLGNGIFTQDGKDWEESRKLLAPMIQRPTLPDLNLFERGFQRLQESMILQEPPADPGTGFVVDVKERLLDLSLRMITDFLLGTSADPGATASDATDWMDKFAAEFNTAFKWISKRERFKIFYWMVDGLEFRKSCSAAKRLVDELICRAMELRKTGKLGSASSETYIALEPLLHHEQDPKPIRDQYMNLILAGKDSSGALLSWVFYALAREPLLLAELTEEIECTLGSDETCKPNKTELNAMLKLDRFVCETLRLFPPVPLNGRFSKEDTYLPRGGGESGEDPVLIPKDTLVAFSTFAVHRNRDLYGQDAGKFRPGRWDDDVIKQRRMVDWSFQPFFAGPRKCLGERFAVTQAKYLTCRMLQHYKQIIPTDGAGNEIALASDGSWVDDVKYHVGLTMMPDAEVWLRFVPKC